MFEIKSDGTIAGYHSSADHSRLLAPTSVFIGRNLQDFIPDPAYSVYMQAVADIDQTGRTSGRSYSLERDDGERYYEISGASIVVNKNDSHYLLLARDVSEQHKADAELRIAATAFSSQESILITDADMRILYQLNPRGISLFS